MTDNNLSLVLKRKDDLCLENRPIPVPSCNEVLIAMHSVGICGTDLHLWKLGCCGDFVVSEPLVIGHEGSGTVLKVGEHVENLKEGDRVCIEPAIPCRMCEFCKKGRYTLCLDIKSCGLPFNNGLFCQYYCHEADLCFKLPDNVSLEEGALMEPLSVTVHACRRAAVTAGSSVLICGAGPIGQLTLLVCKAMGASKICITDICSDRLEVAKKLGATHVVCVKDRKLEEVIEEVKTKIGDSPEITIECSGAQFSISLGAKVTKRGGVVILVGMGHSESTVPTSEIIFREVDIRGALRFENCFPIAVNLVASGSVNVKPLITHRFTLRESLNAFETVHTRAGGAMKVLINCIDK